MKYIVHFIDTVTVKKDEEIKFVPPNRRSECDLYKYDMFFIVESDTPELSVLKISEKLSMIIDNEEIDALKIFENLIEDEKVEKIEEYKYYYKVKSQLEFDNIFEIHSCEFYINELEKTFIV